MHNTNGDSSLVTSNPSALIYTLTAGATTCMLLLLALVVLLVRKLKQQRKVIEMTNEEIDEFMLGIAEEKAKSKGLNGLFILPYDTRLEIPRADVVISKAYNL